MEGSESQPGMIPHSMESLLDLVNRHSASGRGQCQVTMSYLEIYNEQIFDLLIDARDKLPIREEKPGVYRISNLSEVHVTTVEEFKKNYSIGVKNRSVAATKLNPNSSRSHAVLVVKVSTRDNTPPHHSYTAKLHLIDLAGSEDNRKTDNTGERLAESSKINSSLFVLGKVVSALNTKAVRKRPWHSTLHTPY